MPQKIHTDDWNVITGTAALYKYRPVIVDVINTPVTNSRRNPFPQLEGSEGARLANVAGSSPIRYENVLKI